jgi:hypothetical protein
MKALLRRPGIVLVERDDWPAGSAERVFADFDTPSDLADLGLSPPAL